MITVNVHRLLTVVFTISVPNKLTALFTYAFLFTMWIFIRTLLYNCLYTMFTLNLHRYIHYYLQLISPVHLLCCLHMLSFSQCEYISTHCCTIVHIHCLHWIFTITCSTVYNYSPQFSVFAVYICIPFHNVIFFHNYCPIDSIKMSKAYPQHILAALFTISVPNKLTALFTYAFLFTMWIFSTHYCTIVYMTMFTYNLLCLHAVMFKITLPSIMSVLVYLCLFFTMWYFFIITA